MAAMAATAATPAKASIIINLHSILNSQFMMIHDMRKKEREKREIKRKKREKERKRCR